MKIYPILILCLLFSIHNTKVDVDPITLQQKENFEWLLGDWIRINGKEELTTTETWKKISDELYVGTGLSMKNNETVFRENLRIIRKENHWVYEVTGVNEDTTNFRISSFSEDSFTAINAQNPFPKKISYSKNEGKLIAEISDDSKKIVFEFKKN